MDGLVELKREYLNILCNTLAIPIYQGISSVYDIAVQTKEKNNIPKDVLTIFQELLRSVVPRWSPDIIQNEVSRIKSITKHQDDTLSDMFHAILKASILIQTQRKDFSSMAYVSREHYEQPTFDNFIHQCYIFASREFYNNPFLIVKNSDSASIKQNQQASIQIIKDCIVQAVQHFLPLKEILKEYLEEPIEKKKIFTNTVPLIENNENKIDKVFSTYNIRESQPKLMAPPIQQGGNSTPLPVYETNHSLTNFLMEDPKLVKSESIQQSPIQSIIDEEKIFQA